MKQHKQTVHVGRAMSGQAFNELVRRNSAGSMKDRRRESRQDVRRKLSRGEW